MLRVSLRVGLVFSFAAALLPAQSLAPNFAPAADAHVRAVVVQPDGRMVVGGFFRQIAGRTRDYLARLNPDGSFDATFTTVPNGIVDAMALQPDGKLIVAGQFTAIGGQARARIARLNADGSVDASFDPGLGLATGGVSTLLLQPDGKIVAAGTFETAGGELHEGIARLNANGSVDTSFNVRVLGVFTPGAVPGVMAVARQADGALLLAGQFLTVNGQTRNGLARVRSDGTLDAGFAPSTTGAFFGALAVQPDGKILVGGGFLSLAGRSQFARLNPDGSVDPGFAPSVNGAVDTLFLQPDGRVVISGFFSVVGGQPRASFARVQPWGAVDPTFRFDLTAADPNIAAPVPVFAPLADGRVIVAGNFRTIGEVARGNIALLTAEAPSRFANLSTRGFVAAGGSLSMGFVARGGPKSLLLRGVGPTLGAFGVSGALADPQLEAIYLGEARADVTNQDWASDLITRTVFVAAGAFPLPDFSKDAAAAATLTETRPAMTARVTSQVAGGSGIALVEAYDRNTPEAGRLVNLSTLGFAGTGAQALAPGFVITGEAAKRVLIRAIGPGLVAFGVTGTLVDPQIAVLPQGAAAAIASNDNWSGEPALAAAFAATGAFALPANSRDAALVVQLPPGAYTVVVSGGGNATGNVLVELYDLDP